MPRRGRVHHDDVVHAPSEAARVEPRRELLQHEKLGQPRRGSGQHLEAGALEQAPAEDAEPEHAMDERPEGVLGLHRGRGESGHYGARLQAQAAGAEQRAEAPGADLDREDAAAGVGGRVGERGGHDGAPDATLAGDDHEPLRAEGEACAHQKPSRWPTNAQICSRESVPRQAGMRGGRPSAMV